MNGGAVAGTGMLDISVSQIPGFAYDELNPEDVPDDVRIQSLFVGNGMDNGCC